eukprot:SAG31_NODE_3573_length_4113_cov_4.139013_6_plen_147_part_00
MNVVDTDVAAYRAHSGLAAGELSPFGGGGGGGGSCPPRCGFGGSRSSFRLSAMHRTCDQHSYRSESGARLLGARGYIEYWCAENIAAVGRRYAGMDMSILMALKGERDRLLLEVNQQEKENERLVGEDLKIEVLEEEERQSNFTNS